MDLEWNLLDACMTCTNQALLTLLSFSINSCFGRLPSSEFWRTSIPHECHACLAQFHKWHAYISIIYLIHYFPILIDQIHIQKAVRPLPSLDLRSYIYGLKQKRYPAIPNIWSSYCSGICETVKLYIFICPFWMLLIVIVSFFTPAP